MATNFRDDAGIVRLDGTLYAPGATVGDVLTVQADGSLAPAAGGGGGAPQWEAVTVPTDAASWTALDAPATCLADIAPTLPLTIIVATNDTFVYTPDAGGGSPETFTVAPGVYTTIAQCVAAMAAAVGGSAERFDTLVTPSNASGSVLLTALGAGAVSNDNTISEGNGGAAALGFTGNPDFFTGYGGGWTFNAGVITAPTATNDFVVCTTTDEWGNFWAVEAEVSVPMGALGGFGACFNAGAPLTNAPNGQELNGIGFWSRDSNIQSCLYGNCNPIAAPVSDSTYHKIRVINLAFVQFAYLDGVLVGQNNTGPNQSNNTTWTTSRFLLFAEEGESYRNLNAWRIPLPTFP